MVKLFTHTDLDGVGCAFIAKYYYGIHNVDVEYINHPQMMSERLTQFINQEEYKKFDIIYITDISVDEQVAEIADKLMVDDKNVIIQLFDHHPTALLLNKYSWCKVLIDIDGIKTCGTKLFYNYLKDFADVTSRQMSLIVNTICSYDTYRWKETNDIIVKQVNDLYYIMGDKDKFINWLFNHVDTVTGNDRVSFPNFSDSDLSLLEMKQRDIDIYIDIKEKEMTIIDKGIINDYKFGVVFSDRYDSELGNILCERHPEIDYIMMINIGAGKVGLRSVKKDIRLGEDIAKPLGGGGHDAAAGFPFDKTSIVNVVLELLHS